MDELVLNLLFRRFRFGKWSFDFLEGLLAACITIVGLLLLASFEKGLPPLPYLLVEWYLSIACAILVWRSTGNRKKTLISYAILMILPTIVADSAILRGDACVGTLLCICALLFLESRKTFLFTLTLSILFLISVKYIGLLFACMVLWQNRKLKFEYLAVLFVAGCVRFVAAYRAYFQADYSLDTFHWPNIYEILGKEAITGQAIDPAALVGMFLTLGLLVISVYLLSLRHFEFSVGTVLNLFLFFGLLADFFLPYMDQSSGYLFCILAVLYGMQRPSQFLIPIFLQIITFAGYQECFHGESIMPMPLFAVIQFLIIVWLGFQIYESGFQSLWKQKK